MQKRYPQKVHLSDDNAKVVAIGQTRNNEDEWITPIAIWELDDTTGDYMPPGESNNPRLPRVEVIISGIDDSTPLEVRARALESLLQQLIQKDFATQATLQSVLSTLQGTLTVEDRYPEHRLLSTDSKPSASAEGKGAVVFEMDTGKVFMSDGSNWEELE